MLVRDEPLPTLLAQAHREPRRGAEDLQQRMAIRASVARSDAQVCHLERSWTSALIGQEPGGDVLLTQDAWSGIHDWCTAPTVRVLFLSRSLRRRTRSSAVPLLTTALVVWGSVGIMVPLLVQARFFGIPNRVFTLAYGVWLILAARPLLKAHATTAVPTGSASHG
jgi:hypothetical protein